MPKPVHELSPFVYAELRKHIRIKTGLMIQTKSECEILSVQINEQIRTQISASTIYRIFIAEKNSKPYLNTLNGLSVFCGFKDWFDFENHINDLSGFDFSYGKIESNEKVLNSFIKLCIQKNQLEILYQYAEQFPNDVEYDKKIRIGYEFYQSLLDNPNSNIEFFDKFSVLPIIREAFFEIMADPDFKIKDYEYGLVSYLKYCEPPKKIKDYRDIIFAKSMLFRYYVLKSNSVKAVEIGSELYQSKLTNNFDFDKLSIFPKLRYLSYQLLYKQMQSDFDSFLAYKQFLLDYCEKNIGNWTLFEKRVAFYNIADVFNMTNADYASIEKLKATFKELIDALPKLMKENSLESLILYFQENASIKLRNLK